MDYHDELLQHLAEGFEDSEIEAGERLLLQAASGITYEQYAQVITAAFNPSITAFSVPSILKGLWGDLKAIGTHLKESGDVAWEHIVAAFKEKSIFTLLKGVGFSLKKLLQAIHAAMKIPSNAFHAFIQEVVKDFGSLEAVKKLDIKTRLAKLEALLKKHPAIARVSGIALAGFLIWMFIHASFLGHPANDLGLVDAVLDCIHGNFDLVEMFTSPAGLHAIGCLAFGLATGGASLFDYGFSNAEHLLSWMGDSAGGVYGLLLALFYKGAKKVHEHFEFKHLPKELKANALVVPPSPKRNGLNQNWFDRMSLEEKHAYRARRPKTKFVTSDQLLYAP
jgi:hypothetical protein